MSDPNQEISVTKDGITLKGGVVSDVQPVVRRVAKTADSVLRLLDNVVGLPTDFISNNLERFRAKYVERFEEIPLDRRREPPMRIGCAVLKNVAYTGEEPDIQELFANLLASASDSEKQQLVHPAFATVIADMRALEARLLVQLSRGPRQISYESIREDSTDKEEISRAVSNLVRLGLLDWRDKVYDQRELSRFVGKQSYFATRPEDLPSKVIVPLVNDVQKLKNELIQDSGNQHLRRRLEVTAFGRHFVAVVAGDLVAKSETASDVSSSPLRARQY